MKCPMCDAESRVLDSRTWGPVVRRRRACPRCEGRWTTVEMVKGRLVRGVGAPSVPPDVHQAVRFAFEEAARQGLSNETWSRMARISSRTIQKLRGARIPRVDTLDAVLQPLGCELVARKIPTTGKREK
jgi:transcriptional repressor NrdR